MTTARYCVGCDDFDETTRSYVLLDHDGETDTVAYCDCCADHARIGWDGTTSAIVEASARFKASDNPEPFGPLDVADLGDRRFTASLFGLVVGEKFQAVQRVR